MIKNFFRMLQALILIPSRERERQRQRQREKGKKHQEEMEQKGLDADTGLLGGWSGRVAEKQAECWQCKHWSSSVHSARQWEVRSLLGCRLGSFTGASSAHVPLDRPFPVCSIRVIRRPVPLWPSKMHEQKGGIKPSGLLLITQTRNLCLSLLTSWCLSHAQPRQSQYLGRTSY